MKLRKTTKFAIKTLAIALGGGFVGAILNNNRELRKRNHILEGELQNSRNLVKGLQRNNEMLAYNLGKLANEKRSNK